MIQVEYHSSFSTVFELLSGITSQDKFNRRIGIVARLKSSGVKIIWKSVPSILREDVLKLDKDYDIEATKMMYELIDNSTSYEDLNNFEFELGGNTYNLNTLIEHDSNINQNLQNNWNELTSKVDTALRKAAKLMDFDLNYIHNNLDYLLENTLIPMIGGDACIHHPQYVEWKDQVINGELSEWAKGGIWGSYNTLINGHTTGKNDAVDYLHLVYAKGMDYFISDDKFFSRLPSNDIFECEFLTVDSFFKLTSPGRAEGQVLPFALNAKNKT